MPKPEFNMNISMGNVISILTVLASVVYTWGQITANQEKETAMRTMALAQIETQLDEHQAATRSLELRIRQNEEFRARSDVRFTQLLSIMSEIKAELKVLSENQN